VTRLKLPILLIALGATLAFLYIVSQQVFPLIESRGWRLEYMMAIAFMGIVLAPILMMIALDIRKAPPVSGDAARAAARSGLTLPQALKEWRFWLLAISFVPISYAVGAIIPNIERVLTSAGFEMSEAVGLATLTGLAVLGGRVIGGFLIDRFWAPAVAFVFLASPAIALWMLGQPGLDANAATIAILMIGFGAGVEYDFMAYMVSKYFGMKAYSAIYGAIYGFFALGAGLGPSIMTDIADGRGIHFLGINLGILPGQDWNFALTSAAIILFVSTIPLLFLGKYRYTDGH